MQTGAENIKAEGGFKLRWEKLGKYGRLSADGRFSIPVAQTFALHDWREALDISLAGRARGKLVLLSRGRPRAGLSTNLGWQSPEPHPSRSIGRARF